MRNILFQFFTEGLVRLIKHSHQTVSLAQMETREFLVVALQTHNDNNRETHCYISVFVHQQQQNITYLFVSFRHTSNLILF